MQDAHKRFLNWHLGMAERDPKNALKLFEKAAKLGLPAAQRYAGLYLTLGQAGKQDIPAGRKYTLQAAENQDVFAMINLAMFANRGIGVERKKSEIHRWLDRAIATKQPRAFLEVGMGYLTGEYGYEKNEKKGLEFWQKSIAVDDADTLRFLGFAYSAGMGVKKNKGLALSLIEAAYRQGGKQAAQLLAQYYSQDSDAPAETKRFWSTEAAQPGFGLSLLSDDAKAASRNE